MLFTIVCKLFIQVTQPRIEVLIKVEDYNIANRRSECSLKISSNLLQHGVKNNIVTWIFHDGLGNLFKLWRYRY